MPGTLEGRVALVTGAGRSIGRALALKIAREGARVVVNDLDPAPAGEVAAEIRQAGGKAIVCAGSVAASEFADRFIGAALSEFQGLEIIVNIGGMHSGLTGFPPGLSFQRVLLPAAVAHVDAMPT